MDTHISTDNIDGSEDTILNWECRCKRVHTLLSHWYKVQEQAKLIYSIRNEDNRCLESIDRKEAQWGPEKCLKCSLSWSESWTYLQKFIEFHLQEVYAFCVLEKTLESPLDCKEIKPVNPKGNQPWIFIGRTDAEAEAPILWPPGKKSPLTGKDSDAEKDWRQKEKRVTEDEMVRQISQTPWAWIWANSRRQWRTEAGFLLSMRSPRVRHNLATEQQLEDGPREYCA